MHHYYLYGLIGYPLSHSFSQRYFTEKFTREGLEYHSYQNFPISDIRELSRLMQQHPSLRGFNVTIPYKEQIIPYLNEMDPVSAKTGAVNTVQVMRNGNDLFLKGYNTDVYGFSRSLEEWVAMLDAGMPRKALVLGTGGASKAVIYALSRLNVEIHLVSRYTGKGVYKAYEQLDAQDMDTHLLIVNTSPLGMFPNTGECPAIPYVYLTEQHLLYDLVYNPGETLFMRKGREMGAAVHNGERMLYLQADKAWEIWNSQGTGSNP